MPSPEPCRRRPAQMFPSGSTWSDSNVGRRFHESQDLPIGIEDRPYRLGVPFAREVVFPNPEVVGQVAHCRGVRGMGLGNVSVPKGFTQLRPTRRALFLRACSDLVLDVCVQMGRSRGDRFVIAADDFSQRTVEIEGLDFIAVVLRHGHEVAPGEGRHPMAKWNPAAAHAARGANGEHFGSGKGPQRGSHLPFRASYPVVARQTAEARRPVARTNEIGGEDGATRQDIFHREELAASSERKVAAVVPFRVENGKSAPLRIRESDAPTYIRGPRSRHDEPNHSRPG